MSDANIAIKVDDLNKCFRIGLKEQTHEDLSSLMVEFLKRPLKNYRKYRSLYDFSDIATRPTNNDSEDIIWAVKDLSFEVKQGEVLGIIGRNGAGKSTLLKILSKITPPTSGQIMLRGRVSSLLEVGTGFHQELTGRENVYLNGTILGMRKKEVDRKFDEIVNFSGVEKFLDTPVKRYSSGMRVRLAFAVAAHLEPEILIIDEVLAVGDAQFQKKCLNKMQEVGQEGRTVLFVSHNMPAVTRMCERAILLHNGQLKQDGIASEVVSEYLSTGLGMSNIKEWADITKAPGDHVTRLRAVRVKNIDGQILNCINLRNQIGLEMEFDVLEDGHVLMPSYIIINHENINVFSTIDLNSEWSDRPRPVGRYISTAWIPENLLTEGTLFITAVMRSTTGKRRRFTVRDAIIIHVVETSDDVAVKEGYWGGKLPGVVRPLLKWDTQFEPERQFRENSGKTSSL